MIEAAELAKISDAITGLLRRNNIAAEPVVVLKFEDWSDYHRFRYDVCAVMSASFGTFSTRSMHRDSEYSETFEVHGVRYQTICGAVFNFKGEVLGAAEMTPHITHMRVPKL